MQPGKCLHRCPATAGIRAKRWSTWNKCGEECSMRKSTRLYLSDVGISLRLAEWSKHEQSRPAFVGQASPVWRQCHDVAGPQAVITSQTASRLGCATLGSRVSLWLRSSLQLPVIPLCHQFRWTLYVSALVGRARCVHPLSSASEVTHGNFILHRRPAEVSGGPGVTKENGLLRSLHAKKLWCDCDGSDCPASLLETAFSELCATPCVGGPHAGVHASADKTVSLASLKLSTAQCLIAEPREFARWSGHPALCLLRWHHAPAFAFQPTTTSRLDLCVSVLTRLGCSIPWQHSCLANRFFLPTWHTHGYNHCCGHDTAA